MTEEQILELKRDALEYNKAMTRFYESVFYPDQVLDLIDHIETDEKVIDSLQDDLLKSETEFLAAKDRIEELQGRVEELEKQQVLFRERLGPAGVQMLIDLKNKAEKAEVTEINLMQMQEAVNELELENLIMRKTLKRVWNEGVTAGDLKEEVDMCLTLAATGDTQK